MQHVGQFVQDGVQNNGGILTNNQVNTDNGNYCFILPKKENIFVGSRSRT